LETRDFKNFMRAFRLCPFLYITGGLVVYLRIWQPALLFSLLYIFCLQLRTVGFGDALVDNLDAWMGLLGSQGVVFFIALIGWIILVRTLSSFVSERQPGQYVEHLSSSIQYHWIPKQPPVLQSLCLEYMHLL
jgi:hypothetical protein